MVRRAPGLGCVAGRYSQASPCARVVPLRLLDWLPHGMAGMAIKAISPLNWAFLVGLPGFEPGTS